MHAANENINISIFIDAPDIGGKKGYFATCDQACTRWKIIFVRSVLVLFIFNAWSGVLC